MLHILTWPTRKPKYKLLTIMSRFCRKETVLVFLFLLIFFNNFHQPEVVNLSLDPSWKAVFQYAQANGLSVGDDIAFTYGPLGFLLAAQQIYVGYASFAWAGYFLGIIWGCALAISCLYLTKKIPFFTRILVLILCVLLQGNEIDSAFYFILFTTGIYLLNDASFNPSGLWKWIILLLATSTISLTKFTYLPSLIGLFCIIITHNLIKKQYKQSLFTSAIILLTIAASLILTNTSPQNFYQYIINSIHISSGYNQSMTKVPTTGILICGLATLTSLFVYFFVGFFKSKHSTNSFEALLFAFVTFVTWKAGYTRADGHVFIFLNYGLLCICYGTWLYNDTDFKSNIVLVCSSIAPVISLLSAMHIYGNLSRPDHIEHLVLLPYHRAENFVSFPSHIKDLDERWQKAINPSKNGLKDLIGDDLVDVFGCWQGIAIENGLNYLPNPTIQSYAACTTETQKIGLEHHLKFPRHILFKLDPIDRRLPTMDDALLQRHVFWNMDCEKQIGNHLLFTPRKEFNYEVLEMDFSDYNNCKFGEWIELNNQKSSCLFLSAKFRQTLFGRFSGILYKTGRIYITLELDDGRTFKYRYIPKAGESGVLISPLLENNRDICRLLKSPIYNNLAKGDSDSDAPGNTDQPDNRNKIVNRIKFTSKSGNAIPIGYRDEILFALRNVSPPR